MNSTTGESRRAEFFALLVRWGVGSLFIYLGCQKALDPVSFLKLIREYDLVHTPWLLNSLAALLPWFEIFCGLMLLAGVAVRGTALCVLAMLVPFTLAIFRRALAVLAEADLPFCAVKFDCGCGAGEVLICRKLAENGLLIAITTWLVFTRHGRFGCLRRELWSRPQ